MENSRRAPAPVILHTISWCVLSANPLSKAARSTFLTARLATGVAIGLLVATARSYRADSYRLSLCSSLEDRGDHCDKNGIDVRYSLMKSTLR